MHKAFGLLCIKIVIKLKRITVSKGDTAESQATVVGGITLCYKFYLSSQVIHSNNKKMTPPKQIEI